MTLQRFVPLLAFLVAGFVPASRAFVFIEEMPPWPDGTVTLHLQLGTTPTYSDGKTPNSTAIDALEAWNPSMARVQLAYIDNSAATKSRTNGVNNVFFDSTIYGAAFGDGVLAVTLGRSSNNTPIESDVVVNSAKTWDAYLGPQRAAIDLRRVLMHEFGHVLGLDHPNEHGQWVSAIMNSHANDTDWIRQDDQDGVSSRYGRGPGNPATPLNFTSQPFGGTYVEGRDLTLSGEARSSLPVRYQWYKDDEALVGATSADLRLNPLRTFHAGTYHLRATDDDGSIDSNRATLTVTPALIPTFTSHPMGVTRELGTSLDLSAVAESNAYITYQWTRDGVAIPGATSSHLRIESASMTDSGVYRLVASTVSGSATSEPATVTIIGIQPPVFDAHPRGGTVVVGLGTSLTAVPRGAGNLQRQWTRDGVPIAGETNLTLYINDATAADSGIYRMAATNAAGTTLSNPAQITVVPVPLHREITLKNVETTVGSHFYFDSQSPDPDNTSFQWYHNGQPIAGATGHFYSRLAADYDDAGEYFVVATNSAGSITSTTATATIMGGGTPPPGGWRRVIDANGIVYFAFESPARLERFDLAGEQWLTPFALSDTPGAMVFTGPNTAVIALHRTLTRIDLTTGQEAALITLDSDPYELGAHNGRLYVVAAALPATSGHRRLGSIDLAAPATPIWSEATPLIGSGLSIDHTHAKAFTSATSASPPDVTSAVLNPDGTIGTVARSQYFTYRTVGAKTWVNADNSLIVDSSGTIYRTTDLSLAGTFSASFDTILFRNDGSALTLRGLTVSSYNSSQVESGTLQLSRGAHHLVLRDSTLFAFAHPAAGSGVLWEKREMDEIRPRAPLQDVAPEAVTLPVDDVLLDRDGNLLVYSRLHGSVFLWSPREQRYLDAIPLIGRPNAIAYSPSNHRLQLGYADNTVRVIDLAVSPVERVLLASTYSIGSLHACGDFLVVRTSSPRTTVSTYDQQGARLATYEPSGSIETREWEPMRSRFFELSLARLIHLTMDPAGQLTSPRESAFHVDPLSRPLRLSPDGTIAVTGTGKIFDAETLSLVRQLPHGLNDAAWLGTRLYTMQETLAGTEIKRWAGVENTLDASRILGGRSVRLFGLGAERLVAVTHKGHHPHFTLLDADLNIRNHFEDTPDLTRVALTNLSTRAEVGTGDDIVIAGFVVTGSQPKRILVRAVGPGLDRFGVAGTLADPVLKLVGDAGPVAENDDWFTPEGEALKQAFREVFAFGLADTSRDSALVATLPPGKYTAQVSGKDASRGVALVEAYDLDADPGERRLINISTRAVVGVGDKVLIPGLAIEGTAPKRLLIRAVGPELTRFGVAGVLADPQLRVINAEDEVVAANDNWGDDNTEVTGAATTAASAFRLAAGGRDAALVATLPPGSYTVVVSGVGDTSGVALVEIYEVP